MVDAGVIAEKLVIITKHPFELYQKSNDKKIICIIMDVSCNIFNLDPRQNSVFNIWLWED